MKAKLYHSEIFALFRYIFRENFGQHIGSWWS